MFMKRFSHPRPKQSNGTRWYQPQSIEISCWCLMSIRRYLFQLMITNNYLPSEWHTHCVIPIFKSGDRAVISNYHPISLLCIISKVLEKIVFISVKLLSNSFTPHQFGFLPGRSTLQQLLFINELLEAKQTNKVSDVIYLDFKKLSTLL